MEQCNYKPVRDEGEVILKSEKMNKKESWKPLMRQIFICSAVWNAYFIVGLGMGLPTVVIPQLRKEANSTEAVSKEMASWISSVLSLATIPWFIIPIISGRIGRKYPFFFVSVTTFINSIVFYLSTAAKHFLIVEILQGPLFACTLTISVIIISEYSSPKYRGIFLTLKSASFNWGMLVANALGTFFHWKTIAITYMICSIYNLLTTLFWCESPSWLAFNGQYEECAKVHKWIRGEDAECVKELAALITSCEENHQKQDKGKTTIKKVLLTLHNIIKDKAFFMPLLLCIAVLALYHTSGKMVCSIYAIDIIKNMTSSESTAYMGMLLLDSLTLIGMYISCFLVKFIKRRLMLFTGSIGGITFLLILALYMYLCKSKVIDENKYVSLALLSLFFLLITFGPVIMSYSLYGELMPLRYRTAGMFITGVFIRVLSTVMLKTAPKLFETFDLHGTFVLYGASSACIIFFLYKCLPETKDKTLQEIEECFNDKIKKEYSTESQSLTECVQSNRSR